MGNDDCRVPMKIKHCEFRGNDAALGSKSGDGEDFCGVNWQVYTITTCLLGQNAEREITRRCARNQIAAAFARTTSEVPLPRPCMIRQISIG